MSRSLSSGKGPDEGAAWWAYISFIDKCRQQTKEQGHDHDHDAYLGYNATNKDNYPQNTKEKKAA